MSDFVSTKELLNKKADQYLQDSIKEANAKSRLRLSKTYIEASKLDTDLISKGMEVLKQFTD